VLLLLPDELVNAYLIRLLLKVWRGIIETPGNARPFLVNTQGIGVAIMLKSYIDYFQRHFWKLKIAGKKAVAESVVGVKVTQSCLYNKIRAR
jgi:hypothetical protein